MPAEPRYDWLQSFDQLHHEPNLDLAASRLVQPFGLAEAFPGHAGPFQSDQNSVLVDVVGTAGAGKVGQPLGRFRVP